MRFPTSLRWSSCVAPKSPRGSKTQNGRFSSKIALRLKKVCYKVYSCENCQRQSCRAFVGLTIHAKKTGGERPLLPEILGQSDRVGAKSPIFTALHAMQTRSSDENSVCPSVCLSVCLSVRLSVERVYCDKTEEEICSDFYTVRKLSSFMRRRMVGGGRPLLPEILGQPVPVGAKSPILNRYCSKRLSRNT